MKRAFGYKELSRMALYVSLLGWGVLAVYLLGAFLRGPGELSKVISEFMSPEYSGFMVRAFILFAPFVSTVMGYLINERAKFVSVILADEGKLEKAIAQWRGTFDSLPYGMMLIDRDRNIIKVNEYVLRAFGTGSSGLGRTDDVVGKKCYELVHGKDGGTPVCPLKESIVTMEPSTAEYFDKEHNKWFVLGTSPIVGDQGVLFVHSIIDVTELKDKEKKLEDGKAAFFNMLKDLDASYKDLKSIYNGLIFAFAEALDAKSPWTKGHSERVTAFAISIAKEMGLPEREIETLRTAALLHDIGKIGTYDVILDKPGRLTPEEFDLVKQHPAKGAEFLRHIRQMEDVMPAIRHHHERLDGRGYPDGIGGDEIPLLARVLCVADSFDSMTADRPYRPSPGKEFAIDELKRCSGSQFDPVVVAAFLRLLEIDVPVESAEEAHAAGPIGG